ncbi:DUF3857 domain-containing protein [Winogradskyella thalassocola]|uniref:DUF3857 domain-containing protein n=1 Tax=Winogradskyella thalassocola TaxID=262004 RepID=A0A1G8IRD1_9FLAO|nr:DUF3857 domain-containing protein [Winogradskyella thalassocola]SDI21565.1 protein of unknown function [Winogradskyella thalassocola]
MIYRFTIVALLVTFLGFSQNYNVAMEVFKSDLELTSYSKDSTANALVIYDYGNSFVDDKTFWLRVQNEQKIKILRTEGIDRGQFEVKLYKGKTSKEKIENIKGTTYNLENGEIRKTHLTKTAIFEEENENYTLVRFVLPNVKVGSVITVSYETQSRFMAKYQPWYFQGEDPVLYSEYNTSIPANYEYHIKRVGAIPFDTHDISLKKQCLVLGNGASADCSISKYIMKNIPAYKPEDYTTTSLNYTSRIEYEMSVIKTFDGRTDKITKTWEDADHELKTDSDFGRQISKKSLVKDILPDSILAISDQLKKAKALYNYVLNNYKWNGKSERYDVSIKTITKDKVGSAFEINLLLENLLSNEGIKVFPILMSTRNNGLATKVYPVLSDFNYVILKTIIDNKSYYLDATDPYLSFGELPFKALNQYGRLIDFEEGSYWEDININNFSGRIHRVELSSFKDDQFQGTIKSIFQGYHSHTPKRQFDENPSDYLEKKINDYTDIIIEDHDVLDTDTSNFNETLNISIQPEFIGNKIYFNPFIIKFFDKNPFQLQERTYPIDFGYKDIYNYSMKISLNEDLKVIELPKPVNYALPNKSGSLLFNIELLNDEIVLYFKVKFNQPIYPPEYYPYLKSFMDKVVELQNNTIIALEKQ